MKKKLFSISIVCLLFASCSKDRTCTCTSTNSGNSDSSTHTTTLVKVSKSQAKANCVSSKYDDSKGVTHTQTCNLD
ncbi:MAG: hypothetical protein WCR21_12220 [Bacteroidota bacterium]